MGRRSIPTPNDFEPSIRCRYDPVLGDRSDLVLRCRCDPADRGADLVRTLRIRWWCDAGHILVWEASPRILELPETPGWTSLSVAVPVPPLGCGFLRFDLLLAIGGNRVTAATGFVQPWPIQAAFHGSVTTLSSPPEQQAMRLPLPPPRLAAPSRRQRC